MAVERVAANGVEIAYEAFGDPSAPPILLIMGLGTQMIAWPDEMCEQLAGAGHRVIRYDNRDVGLSTHLDEVRAPSLPDIVLHRADPPYSISDMADDGAELLTALGIETAHIVGASMGGFIAQHLALRHRSRVRSMTLIMTSTGSKLVGNPKPKLFARLTKRRGLADRTSAQQYAIETFRIIGSRGYAFDEDYLAELAGESYDRAHDPGGYLRQLAAIVAQPNRNAALARLDVPALVIHGLHDPLVSPSGGLAAAKRLRNAKFVGYNGMGHDLPRELWPDMVREIAGLAARADGSEQRPSRE